MARFPVGYTWTVEWDPEGWVRDYTTGTHLEAAARRLEARLERVRDRGAANEAALEAFERRVTRLLSELGVSREHMPFYHGYALERWARAREKKLAADRLNEARMIRMKWESRGLEKRVLDELDRLVPVS